MSKTLAYGGYSSESAQRVLSNEYQHDRVWMDLEENLSILVLWMRVVLALERLTHSCLWQPKLPDNFADISLTKAIFRKYLKENCSSELFNSPSNILQIYVSF